MMAESEIRERLTEALRTHEPTLATAPRDLRVRAVRLRRRRRLAGVLATGAVAASVAIGVWGGPLRDDPTQIATPTRDEFSPDELAAVMTTHAQDLAPEAWTAPRDAVDALDAQSHVISGADRDKASRWYGTFEFGPRSVLEISLHHVRDGDRETQQEYCDNNLRSGETLSCEVTVSADGIVVRSSVSGLTRQDGAWPVVFSDRLRENPDSLWFQRAVHAYRPDGSLTVVDEKIKAPSIREAERAWLASPGALISIAADPALAFPEPPPGVNGCDWTIPERRELYECGQETRP